MALVAPSLGPPMQQSDQPSLVRIPRDMIFPIRPAGPIEASVTTLDGDNYKLLIGGVGPLSGATNADQQALCMRHFRLILRILNEHVFDSPEVEVNFSDLLDYDGSTTRKSLYTTIAELDRSFVHVVRENPDGAQTHVEHLLSFHTDVRYQAGVSGLNLKDISKEDNIFTRRLRNVRFSEHFWRACLHWAKCWSIRADAFLSLRSDIAAGTYLLLSPRAYNSKISADNKGRIDAASLLHEMGAVVPKRLVDLRRVFERPGRGKGDKRSILEQISGLPTFYGFLAVDPTLELNATKTGYNVRYWALRDLKDAPGMAQSVERMKTRGKLFQLWLEAGRTEAEYDKAQRFQRNLETWEEDTLQQIGYPVGLNRAYLELIRSFIGPAEFHEILGSAKLAKNEGSAGDMGKFVGGAFRNAFLSLAKQGPRLNITD